MTVSEQEISDFSEVSRLDVSQFEIKVKDNPENTLRMAIVGLGATGSAFMMLLAHFLKYNSSVNIDLYDFDWIEDHNHRVSMYGFSRSLGLRNNTDSKAQSSKSILLRLIDGQIGMGDIRLSRSNKIEVNSYTEAIDQRLLELRYNDTNRLDYLFIFTDNNESRHEISEYSLRNPHTVIIDTRIGTYDQFEVYYSNNPEKYKKTIYYEDDGSIMHIDGNRVCLDDRMSFSVAMTASSLAMNMFLQHVKSQLRQDFKHIMIGRDFIGEVKGYDE